MSSLRSMYVVLRGGYTFTTDETWQTGLHFLLVNDIGTPDNVGDLPTVDIVDEDIHRTETDWTIMADWSAHFGLGSDFHVDDWLNDQIGNELRNVVFPRASNKVQLRTIHAWPVGTDGLVVDGHTAVLSYTGSLPGGSHTGNPLPLENTPVVSLHTGRIGRHGRGRMYWPVQPTSDIDASGKYDHTARDDLRDTFVTFLEDIAVTGGVGHSEWCLPIVTGKGTGKYAVVTEVAVGDIMDTQRRRRRQETEAYGTAAVTY